METIKHKNGTITYREKVYINGRSVSRCFKRKTDAHDWKKKMELERNKCEFWGVSSNTNISFNDFIGEWLEIKKNENLARRTIDKYEYTINAYFLPFFMNKNLKEIALADGHKLVAKLRLKGNGPDHINFVIRILKQVLGDAVKRDYLLKNPFLNLSKVKTNPRIPTFWTVEEVKQFLNANKDSPLYELYLLALNTGMRRGELLGLCWDKIDLAQGRIEISRTRDRYGLKETTKTRRVRYIFIRPEIVEVMKRYKEEERHEKFVFAFPDGKLVNIHHISDRAFKRAITRAGVKKIRFHDLRTTYASNYVMAENNSIYDLSKILGHSSVKMTEEKYAYLHQDHLRRVNQKICFMPDDSGDRATGSNLRLVGEK